MQLLDGQKYISPQFPMPVDVMDQASRVTDVSGETVQFVVASTNVNDAGSAAGTVVYFRLTNGGILDSAKAHIGDEADTSFVFGTGTALTTQIAFPIVGQFEDQTNSGTSRATKMASIGAGLSNGQYVLDHRLGIGIGKKATTGATDTASYSYRSSVSASVLPSGSTVGPTPGTTWTRTTIVPSAASQILIAANTSRKGLRIVFNQGTLQTLYFSPGTASYTSYFTSQVGSGELELWDTSNPYTGVWNVIGAFADGTIQVWELT